MRFPFPPFIKTVTTSLLQCVLPARCAQCGCVMQESGVCGACWRQLNFLGASSCVTCGFPLPFPPFACGPPPQCARCTQSPPPFEKARCVLAYDTFSRGLIFRFKHGKELSLAPLFARWLFERGRCLWSETDLILPVPLHWTRLAARSFNQAALLTRALRHQTGLPETPFLLRRHRRTPSQGHLTYAQRALNVKDAFKVVPRFRPQLKRARVVLVDDVYTTGATLEACARVLLKEGAAAVSVLTLARVTKNPRSIRVR